MTSLEEIYEMFLASVSDYKILALAKEEAEKDSTALKDVLFGYYKFARARFYRCTNNLEVDSDKKFILGDLTYYEAEIIVMLMQVAHITPQLLASENLKQSLSDKDFKIYSQANQLREIRLLLNSLHSRSEKMITQYTFFSLGSENGK